MKRQGGPGQDGGLCVDLGWRAMCRLGMEEMMETQRMKRHAAVAKEVMCDREGDRKRHKCREERRKPVREQRGAVQCV